MPDALYGIGLELRTLSEMLAFDFSIPAVDFPKYG